MARTIKVEYKTVDCWKCHGTGYLAHYAGIAQGICFACAGNKVRPATKEDSKILEAYKAALDVLKSKRLFKIENANVGDVFAPETYGAGRLRFLPSPVASVEYIAPTEEKYFSKGKVGNSDWVYRGWVVIKFADGTEQKFHDGMEAVRFIDFEKKMEILRDAMPEEYRNLLKVVEK